MNKFGRAVAILNRSGVSARGRYKVRAHFPPTRYHIKALAAGCARRVAKLGGVRMLEVYIYAHGTRVEEAVPSGMELIRDPEAYFSCLELRCDDIDRDLVRVIEEGTLLDGSRFLDRFGVTLYTQQLSTGCKAALTVNNSDTLKMTMDLYTHLFEDKKLEELTKLDAHSEDVFTSSDSLKEQRYRETLNPKVVPISEVV